MKTADWMEAFFEQSSETKFGGGNYAIHEIWFLCHLCAGLRIDIVLRWIVNTTAEHT
jgi:hypothetical protein